MSRSAPRASCFCSRVCVPSLANRISVRASACTGNHLGNCSSTIGAEHTVGGGRKARLDNPAEYSAIASTYTTISGSWNTST